MRKFKSARLLSLLVALFLFIQNAFAQSVVTGTVTDQNGKGIPNVTVAVKGTSTATETDGNGKFSITAAGNAVLVFSSVGYATTEVPVQNRTSISTTLGTHESGLNEVVVIGYGTRKVKDLTGSVAALTPKDYNKGVISTPEQLIQGRTPGVIITPSSGEPGAASTITIRGSASFRGNQEPLYVVDGVPISSGGTTGTAVGVEGSSTPKNPLMFLNPNDIESITILKDASSAAIYGSRGANGVILITTKSGKGAKGSLQFSSNTSVSYPASRYHLLNAQDFLLGVRKANIDAGTSPADAAAAVLAVDKGANTDWQDQIYRTAISQNYNLSYGIGRKQTSLRLSGSYDDQEGIIKNSGLKRLTGRANLTQRFLKDKLKFDVAATYSNVKDSYAPNTNNAGYQGSLIGAAIAFNPTYPIYDATGAFFDPKDGNRNPVEMLNYFKDNDNINRFLGSISGSYQITNGLVFKSTFGYDDSKSERTGFADPRLSSNAFGGNNNIFGVDLQNPITGNGRGFRQNLDLKSILVEHTLTYDKDFGNNNIDAVIGYGYQSTETNYKGRIGWGLNNPAVNPKDVFQKDFGQFKNYKDDIPNYSKVELQSFFGRLNYNYLEKYYLTGTVRVDGSSKFGKNNRYGTFPAFAAKWRVLKEDFAKNSLGKIFNEFDLRANYGILGSQDGIGPYDALYKQTSWYDGSGQLVTQTDYFGNPNLKWEQAATTGAGVDFSIFNRRLSGTVDYFSTKRKDILFFGPTPGGFAPSANWFTNLPGYVLNRGWEFSFDYHAIDTKKFKWEINYNMTFVKNEVKDLGIIVNTGAVNGQGLSGAYAQVIKDGYPLFSWKMPVFSGFDGNGNQRFANGDPNDKIVGSALPKFLAGLTNNFSFGRLSASVFINTSRGFYVYNNTANALFLKGSLKTAHNVTYDVYNSPEDPINPGSVSTRFLEKGDFIRISNASLSYMFNLNSHAIKSLSVSVTGQNLALFTKYTGLDPEVNVDHQINGYPSRGFDYAGYPKPRTFSFGVNVGF